ncbi:MAG: hypothetical protein IPL84_01355 [Chitinophagaceae bacterium]|nr:hypothetical protein [Chitinophagaceae bacterium]
MKKIFFSLLLAIPGTLFAQSVAINTDGSQPDNTALLDIKSNSKGFLAPRMTSAQRTGIVSPAIGLTVFDTDSYSYWVYRGDVNGNWAELQHNYQNYWSASGANIYNNNNGNIGMGINNPAEKLSINATNPSIQLLNAGSAKGYLQANSSDMKLGTYVNNTTGKLVFNTRAVDRMIIDENGLIGIGTSTPSSTLTINSTNPILQMRNGNIDKGFVQIVNDDIKIGTNLSNTAGNFIVRTGGTDRLFINDQGQIGIGTNDLWNGSVLTIDGVNNTGKNYVNYRYDGVNYLSTKVEPYTSTQQFLGNYVIKGFVGTGIQVSNYSDVAIGGTTMATGYQLSVHGKVIGIEFTTLPINNWPDYVFEKRYKLMPLAEVSDFIKANNHLPNIPAASEIEKNGIQLGDMSRRLTEKVEELTLYVIQLQEQINDLKKTNNPR